MKHLMLSLFVALSLIFTGCTKPQPDIIFPTEPQLAIIKKTSADGKTNSYYDEFFYDNTNRIKEIKSHGISANTSNKTYTYPGSIALYRYFQNGSEVVSQAIDYKLNEQNLAQEQYSSYYGFRSSYEYNSQNFLKKVDLYTKGVWQGYILYHYKGNNTLDSVVTYEADSSKAYTSVFTYITGKRNTIGNENKGLKMLGKDQLSLLKMETRYIYNYPGAKGRKIRFFENEYDYTYDTKGRVKTSSTTRTDYSYPGNDSIFYILEEYEYLYK